MRDGVHLCVRCGAGVGECCNRDKGMECDRLEPRRSAEAFAAAAMRATGGEGPTSPADLAAAMNRRMMRVDMVDRVGRPAGSVALPEDVAAGALLVSRWLQQQTPGTILYGLELSPAVTGRRGFS